MFDKRAVALSAAKFPRFHISRTGGKTLPPKKLNSLKFNGIFLIFNFVALVAD